MALTFLQSAVDATNQTTYTFSSQNFGTASADRYIIAALNIRVDGAGITSLTIGGVTATQVILKQFDATSEFTAIYIAAVPTGTSGNVVIVLPTGGLRAGIALWAGTGFASATATDAQSASAESEVLNPAPSVSINVPANGFVVASSMTDNGTAVVGCAWTGLTEKFDEVVESQSRQSGASDTFVSANPSLTVTATWTATLAAAGLVVASWAPAGVVSASVVNNLSLMGVGQ